MLILAVESSCDETAVALVRDGRELVTDQVFSQADLHAVYGGVVPEIASRSHVEVISLLAERALQVVGVNFAKAAAMALGVPLIPVHHIRGHIAANYLAFPELEPPFLCLAISGGNTLIADVRDYTDIRILGSTRDDAAGECFDKTARVLGLGYPGGGPMDKLSQSGDDSRYAFPRASVHDHPLDMSFSGLKTAVLNLIHNTEQKGERLDLPDLAASFSAAVSDSLIPRVMEAVRLTGCRRVAAAGGVAANSRIRRDLERACRENGCRLWLPDLALCGDNAAMIGCQGYYEYLAGHTAGMELNAYATRDIGRG